MSSPAGVAQSSAIHLGVGAQPTFRQEGARMAATDGTVVAEDKDAAATTAAATAGESGAPRPLSILILGGTGLTGPHQVRYALTRGHRVTLFNRGLRPKEWPAPVEVLVGDREQSDYTALRGRAFDICIDNPTSVPHWVRDAAVFLKGNVSHYIFMSTLSVYGGECEIGADESAPRAKYEGKDPMAETMTDLRSNMALYGPLKALAEDEAQKQFAGITTVIRPGLIVGPGDESDRFTYWPVRLARGGRVLTPPLADPVQFIDVRDLAEWTIRIAERRCLGAFNAQGPDYELSMAGLLNGIRAVTTGVSTLCEASAAFLEQRNVHAWSDLPVWVPGQGETAGFHRRSNARAIAAGLTFRPLAATIVDTLAWWERQSDARKAALRAGMTAERETELLRQLEA
jgi:2'-hydroxyisoflavone reductase